MGTDNLFKRRSEERKKRNEEVLKQKSSNWLIVCEGTKTEPNYFREAIDEINKNIDEEYRLKVEIVGKGMNTTSLVKSALDIQSEIDGYKLNKIPYGKIFVVFDKDDFTNESFDSAIVMCDRNGYIPLWSNQAIEFWFLLHFNLIDGKIDRKDYANKLNEYFKKAGYNYKYKKNDKNIYTKLCEYGSLDKAIKNSKRIYMNHIHDLPSKSESCTTIHKFFDIVNDRLEELE